MNNNKILAFINLDKDSKIDKSIVKNALCIVFVLLLLVISGCSQKEIISYDINTYLSGNSDFKKNISKFMPTKDDLSKSNVSYYYYYDNGQKGETSEEKMVQLTLEYTSENFSDVTQALNNNVSLHYDETTSRDFYYNDNLYQGFIFHDNGYCAIAYCIIPEAKTVSYIAFDSWNLQFMDVESAFELFIN